MKVWAVGVVAFFGLAELYQWFHSLSLPLPVYGVAGLLLALASNAERWSHLLFASADPAQQSRQVQPAAVQTSAQPVQSVSPAVQPAVESPVAGRQPLSEPARSISFTIHKPQR